MAFCTMVTECTDIHRVKIGPEFDMSSSESALWFNQVSNIFENTSRNIQFISVRYWPTTPGPPLRPRWSPRPRRRSARPGCQPYSYRWFSLASASASVRTKRVCSSWWRRERTCSGCSNTVTRVCCLMLPILSVSKILWFFVVIIKDLSKVQSVPVPPTKGLRLIFSGCCILYLF